MKRSLLHSSAFVRAFKRILKKHPQAAPLLRDTLQRLADDAYDPLLRTHKLKGDLEGRWACASGYDLRVVFRIVEHEGSEAILLLTAGTHDEVY